MIRSATWFDPSLSDPRQLGALLKAPPEDLLDCYPVSRKVNSVRFDEPEYAEKVIARLFCDRTADDDPLVTCLFVDNVEQWLTIRIAHEICNEKADRRPENILRDICTVG